MAIKFWPFRLGNKTLISTFVITLPLMLSPGPANLVSLLLSSRFGARRIVLFQCGILSVYAAFAFGIAATTAQFGDFFRSSAPFVQVVGGAFIVYLGIRLARAWKRSGEVEHLPTFKAGAFLQMLNPKFPPVVLTVLASRAGDNAFATAGVIVAVGALGLVLYSCAGSLIHRMASAEHKLRLLNVAFGLLLCAVGVGIAVGAFVR